MAGWIPLARAVALLLLCVFLTRGAAAQDQRPPEFSYHYYYFKQRITLPLDTTRIAVYRGADKAPGALARPLAATLARAGLDASQATPWPISGWSLVPVPLAKRSAAEVERIVALVASDPTTAFVSPVFFGNDGGPVIITPNLLVGFSEATAPPRAEEVLAQEHAGAVIDRDWTGMKGVYRTLPTSTNGLEVLATANRLALHGETNFAEPDMMFTGRAGEIPNDPGFPDCWGLHNTGQFGGVADMDMDAPEAWDISKGVQSVVVVVIDVGIEQAHPDINQIAGMDFTGQGGGGGPVNACDSHGTATAGCVSARINNGLGTVGVAPLCPSASARTFISNQPCTGNWTTQLTWTVNALDWALNTVHARVTNNSNGYGITSSTVAQKYLSTYNAGLVHFACAGNDGLPSLWYPASIPVVNAVASLDRTGARSSFSNYGTGLDFSAPGREIYTTDRTGALGWVAGDYVWADGTSFASPYAAGVAALVFSLRPGLTSAEVEQTMQQSSTDLGSPGFDTGFGWGFVNAQRAAVHVPPTPPNPVVQSTGCAEVTLARSGSPPAGVTWYWQGTACGTRTDLGSALTFVATASGTYSLRARNNTSALWSTGCGSVAVTVCPADFNCDGFLDPLDYNGFINAFEGGDMSADYNGDGFLDPLDYNGFINDFEAGC